MQHGLEHDKRAEPGRRVHEEPVVVAVHVPGTERVQETWFDRFWVEGREVGAQENGDVRCEEDEVG